MDRRALLSMMGAAAALATASQASAQEQEGEDMHPPKYKALEEAASHCVMTGNDCLRHCFGMFAMKDTSMGECAASANQLVAACNALQVLAAANSQHVAVFARAVAEICAGCKEQCDKFPKVAECKAYAGSCRACLEECHRVAACPAAAARRSSLMARSVSSGSRPDRPGPLVGTPETAASQRPVPASNTLRLTMVYDSSTSNSTLSPRLISLLNDGGRTR